MRCFLLPVLAFSVVLPALVAQSPTSQHLSAVAAGTDFRVGRSVAVVAVSRDPRVESAEHMEKLRTVGLGALKGTSLHAVHHGEPAQMVLELTTIPKTAQAGPITTVVLRENASGKPVYCASEQGMEEHSAARQMFTQFNAVVSGVMAAPSTEAMEACVANAGVVTGATARR